MIIAYYYSDKMDCCVDVFVCTTEAEGILRLASIMKECSGTRPDFNRILNTAIKHAKKNETDEAFQCLDTWVKEFNEGGNTFDYKFKNDDTVKDDDDDRCSHGMFCTGAGACSACGG
jgi:hypothetical protein